MERRPKSPQGRTSVKAVSGIGLGRRHRLLLVVQLTVLDGRSNPAALDIGLIMHDNVYYVPPRSGPLSRA